MKVDDQTPIERPLLRSDLNEVRACVFDMAQKLLWMEVGQREMKTVLEGFVLVHQRLEAIEVRLRRVWIPAALGAFILVLNATVTMLR